MKFQRRPLQQAVIDAIERFKVAVVHRRYGKTTSAVDWLDETVSAVELPDPKGWFVFPYAKQGEEAAWHMILEQFQDREDVEFDKWRLEVRLPKRDQDTVGPSIKLVGGTDYHKHRGKYGDAVAFDEVPFIPPAAWRTVFRPMLADRGGKAMFIGTPMGKDWFFDLYKQGQTLENWRSWLANVYDTGVLPDAEIQALRNELEPHEFAREFLCDFDVAAPGAYYQRQFNAMLDRNQIADLPYLPDEGVITSWFFDANDSITVAFWQRAGAWLHCIEVLRELNGSLPDMVQEVKRKPYVYDQHLAPAHADRDSFRIRLARQLGVKLDPLRKQAEHMDTVEKVRSMLPRIRMDKVQAEDLVEAGRHYHADWDEQKRTFRNNPVEDWSHELCGALGVFCEGFNERRSDWSQPIAYAEVFRA